MMGVINNNRVRIWNINATLHDIRTNQYIIFLFNEIEDSFFKLVTFQLPMSVTDTKIRAKCLDHSRHLSQSLDPVMNKKYLSTPFRLKINCITNKIFIKILNFSLYRLAVWWRSIDDTQISRSHQ